MLAFLMGLLVGTTQVLPDDLTTPPTQRQAALDSDDDCDDSDDPPPDVGTTQSTMGKRPNPKWSQAVNTTMVRVRIVSDVVKMLDEPGIQYHPEWNAIDLEPETGNPQASLENCHRLLSKGLTWLGFVAGPAGIVVIFETGETILSTGLALGGGPRTEALAALAAKIGLGPADELARWYTSLGADYRGPVPAL
jgi:hypothetical protein